ncbi:MAG: SDR family NAD(P)-dependent oxidoreductase, partial [bacterium]|nr:SDR family NAD(P)-dependent oxidoreductase [bacterium]
AIADNDLIYGVIKGSSMNHGGKTSGYTVPNPNAQAAVILQALKNARIDARTISYVEAHGTGTALGDPIEVRGLQEAFETFTQDKQYCAIGSVKSNIGHLESAAGISQLAKVLLQMRHKQLVPTLHAEQLNPFINFKDSPFYVQRELSAWNPVNNIARRAGVSSFGAGGANVHMVIEEYVPAAPKNGVHKGPYLFLLSGLNEERLGAQIQQMLIYLANDNAIDESQWLSNACYTLQVGRESMASRIAISVHTKHELLIALDYYPEIRAKTWINHALQNNNISSSEILNLLEEGAQEELAQHWVNGVKVDWIKLYKDQLPDIIPLPTYAFTKRRCWIPTKTVDSPILDTPTVVIPEVQQQTFDLQEWLYKTQWVKTPQKNAVKPGDKNDKWLIFSDHELGLVLQQALGSESSIYCFVGDKYEQINETVFYINPSQKADYVTLFNVINELYGQQLKGVIYLCSSFEAVEGSHSDPSLALLYLFKAMIIHIWSNRLTFCLVSQFAQQVSSSETINLWQHHLWSMTRIFGAEQANYQVLLLDLDINESLVESAHTLFHELGQYQANQNHVAYRQKERHTIRFSSNVPLDSHAVSTSWSSPVAALITGGLGALGYEVAEFLASRGTRFLLLTGTTVLTSQTTEKNTWIKRLEAKGVQVNYYAVDVADKNKMQQVINDSECAWNQSIDGVFHLAGVTTDNVPIAQMSESLWQDVLKVKIKGAMVLHELFLQAKLSSFVLFSSIAAVPHFGMAGLSAYAVANEFISGLALYRRSLNLPAMSINWVAWSEKGMSHRHNHDAFLDAVGMASLSIKEGIYLL